MELVFQSFLRKVRIFRIRSLSLDIRGLSIVFIFVFSLILIILAGQTRRISERDFFQELQSSKFVGGNGKSIYKAEDCALSANEHVKQRLKKSEDIWRKSVQKRKDFVKDQGGLKKVEPWSPKQSVYYWDYFLPSFNCPHLIQRIGRIGDGGKWTCGFEIFENLKPEESEGPEKATCLVYSFGVANESSFEEEFLQRTNCDIYAFDFSVDHMGSQISQSKNQEEVYPRVTFEKVGLGDGKSANETFQTLGEIMRRLGHEWIDVLKIDIEGNEFSCLGQIMEEFQDILPFGQLLMEIHVDHYGRGFSSVYKWWERMEAKGLRAFKSEVNHHSCVGGKTNPVAVEYSFLNVKGNHRLIR